MSAKNGKTIRRKKRAESLPEIILTAVPAPMKAGRHLVTSRTGESRLAHDTLDLNSHTGRKRFVGATLRKAFPALHPDDWPETLRADLEERLLALAAVPPGDSAPAPAAGTPADDPRVEALARMPEDIRSEAARLLEDPRLLQKISEDIKTLGVVGEHRLALTIYLIGVHAQLDRPLSAIVRGSSSSGKSYVCDRTASLFPPEVVLHATSLTTNSLYYAPAGILRHRWIVAGERSRMEEDDTAEATRALREMIESGRLSKLATVKQPDGTHKSELIEQEGPIAFTESTTLGRIFEEDANRCLLLASDETEAQTKRILHATASAAAGAVAVNRDRTEAVHHALQRMIPRVAVTVPFAEAVAAMFPSDRLDSRRSFRHLLQLVKAVALLHFKQRKRDAGGAVVAELSDYQVAAELAAAPLAASRGELGDATIHFFDAIRAKYPDAEFDSNQAQDAGRLQRSMARTRLSELATAGLVEQTAEHKGNKPARWRLTGKEPTQVAGGLPTVAQLSEWISARTHGRGE